jgi:hypothetical protein
MNQEDKASQTPVSTEVLPDPSSGWGNGALAPVLAGVREWELTNSHGQYP